MAYHGKQQLQNRIESAVAPLILSGMQKASSIAIHVRAPNTQPARFQCWKNWTLPTRRRVKAHEVG
jgi:hypothetical protein